MKKVLVLFIVLLLIPIAASANDASMGRNGETVYPLEETDVRMVAEDIYVKYNSGASGQVKCEFVFENSGEAKTVLMGFPAEEKLYAESLTTIENVRLRNFTADKNGSPIEVKEIPGEDMGDEFSKYTSWYVFEVPFEAGETLTMTHEYDVSFTGYSTGQVMVGYILETGSTWNGPIGHTKVTFDFTDMNPWGITMQGYPELNSFTYENGLLIFEKSDYVPDFNLNVEVFWLADVTHTDTSWKEIWPEIDERFNESKAFFDNSSSVSANGLVQAYNELTYTEKLIETIYLNTIMGISEEPYAPVAVKMEKDGTRRFKIYIKDQNFDMDDNATITMMGSANNVIKTDALSKTHSFDEYGTTLYFYKITDEHVKEAYANNLITSYVITVIDEMGNESKTVFAGDDFTNNRTTIISGKIDEGSEEFEIVNPPTSASVDYQMLAAIMICISLFVIVVKNKIGINKNIREKQ